MRLRVRARQSPWIQELRLRVRARQSPWIQELRLRVRARQSLWIQEQHGIYVGLGLSRAKSGSGA